jgi:hypothetical protein
VHAATAGKGVGPELTLLAGVGLRWVAAKNGRASEAVRRTAKLEQRATIDKFGKSNYLMISSLTA